MAVGRILVLPHALQLVGRRAPRLLPAVNGQGVLERHHPRPRPVVSSGQIFLTLAAMLFREVLHP